MFVRGDEHRHRTGTDIYTYGGRRPYQTPRHLSYTREIQRHGLYLSIYQGLRPHRHSAPMDYHHRTRGGFLEDQGP